MQTIAKAESTVTGILQELNEVEKLVFANDPRARAALQSLGSKMTAADHELTAFEKLMDQSDADDATAIRFNINLPTPSRRTH